MSCMIWKFVRGDLLILINLIAWPLMSVRQLCVLLNSKDIYLTLAQILLEEENLKFASIMVETLNTILLTSPELFELRSQLKHLRNEVISRNIPL